MGESCFLSIWPILESKLLLCACIFGKLRFRTGKFFAYFGLDAKLRSTLRTRLFAGFSTWVKMGGGGVDPMSLSEVGL